MQPRSIHLLCGVRVYQAAAAGDGINPDLVRVGLLFSKRYLSSSVTHCVHGFMIIVLHMTFMLMLEY